MFTLTRLSVSFGAITLGLGLFLGGCASETEEPDSELTTASAETEQAAPAETAEAPALPPGDEENLGKNSSEIGFYGGWGMPMYGGWGWGGAMPIGVGWGGAGWGWGGGVGWGGVGWGGGVATSTTVMSSSTMVGGVPGWGWGGGCFGCW